MSKSLTLRPSSFIQSNESEALIESKLNELNLLTNDQSREEDVSYELSFPTDSFDLNKSPLTNNSDIANLSLSPLSKEFLSDSEKLQHLLANNQLNKSKLDEITNESKRINNNLKLYLIVNILNNSNFVSNSMEQDLNKEEENTNVKLEDDETPVSIFRMKYFVYRNNTTGGANKCIHNCLTLLTDKSIVLFKIMNSDLYNKNMEFDKCLKKKFKIDINQIEIIELGLGQYYLIVDQQENNQNCIFKFITLDSYLSQAFLNILLSNLINLNEFYKNYLFLYFKKK